ncbi:CBO0543 family protein [Evansella halocellulosilytica]|uniref:CBO0543 family protein n=1 Tax=Evansella halocellulosilytica TaxID=2011013 RepID=UPI000BB9A399
MKLEKKILIIAWIICSIALLIFVPKNRIREASVVFLFKQLLTWIFGIIVVQKGFIKYPYREFSKAIKTSFSFEYYIYPALCVIFNLCFPKQTKKVFQFGYYVLYTSIITAIEFVLERNTQLIKYIHWRWYWTWTTLFLTFYLSRKYYLWFFNKSDYQQVEAN